MDDLRRIYRQALPGRISALESARAQLGRGGDAAADAAATIRRVAHSLRGSGGTYGFPEVSTAAAALEEARDGDLQARLDELVELLRGTASGADAQVDILAIEDEPDQALLIRAALGRPGMQVTVAGSAEAAEAWLASHDPALVLLDLVLPDADGRALLLRLRDRPRTGNTPIIVLSGSTTVQAKTECFALGANGFVEKPFDPEMLLALVEAQLRNRVRSRSTATEVPARGGRILVVEDDDMVASILKHRLSREGFHIQHFSDGVAALEAVRREPVDLAILDVKVPGLDGFQLLTELRALPTTATIPVVMLTAMGSERDILRGFDLGANDYITKPFSPVEVMARVKRLLQP